MAGEELSTPTAPIYKPPRWAQALPTSQRREFDQARAENIEELLPGVRAILEECIPGISTERPEEFEAAALRWATGCRNNYEIGIQQGFDAVEQSRAHSYEAVFMRNAIEAVPGC